VTYARRARRYTIGQVYGNAIDVIFDPVEYRTSRGLTRVVPLRRTSTSDFVSKMSVNSSARRLTRRKCIPGEQYPGLYGGYEGPRWPPGGRDERYARNFKRSPRRTAKRNTKRKPPARKKRENYIFDATRNICLPT